MKPRTAATTVTAVLLGLASIGPAIRFAMNTDRPIVQSSFGYSSAILQSEALAGRAASGDRDQPLSREALEKKIRAIMAIPNSAARLRSLLKLTSTLSLADFPVALEILPLPANDRQDGEEQSLILRGWAEYDRDAALAWSASRPKERTRLVDMWLRQDPDGVVNWLSTSEARKNENWDQGMVLSIVSYQGVHPKLEPLLTGMSVNERDQILGEAVHKLITNGCSNEVLFPLSDRLTPQARDSITKEWAEARMGMGSESERILSWVLHVDPSGEMNSNLRRCLTMWRGMDAPAAEAWISSHDVPQSVRDALESSSK